MKGKVLDSLVNVTNEKVVTNGDRQNNQPTHRQSDELLAICHYKSTQGPLILLRIK